MAGQELLHRLRGLRIDDEIQFMFSIDDRFGADGHSRLRSGSEQRTDISDIETVNWHTLRHSAGSLWIRAGASLIEVSRRLGHSSTDFTARIYIHTFEDQQTASAHALDRLIS